MEKNIKKLWNSTEAFNIRCNLKEKYKLEDSENITNKIAVLCGNEFAKEFVSWLIDFVSTRELIAFETGLTLPSIRQTKIGI